MRIPRIYHPDVLHVGHEVALFEDATNHVSRVLRMHGGQALELFNGNNLTFAAEILHTDNKKVKVKIISSRLFSRESPLHLHLGQVISRGERMEFTIQKSIELGVNIITPLFSKRCGVKISAERLAKKVQQWQKIVIAACEQCGRNTIPEVRDALLLENWCQQSDGHLKLNLSPYAQKGINSLPQSVQHVQLLVGSEGGLTDKENDIAARYGFTNILLGPRTLRTETTALTAITALQLRYGDLG